MTNLKVVADADAAGDENGLARNFLLSGDLIIGLIGHAGAGCTDVYKRLKNYLEDHEFETRYIKLSGLIAECAKDTPRKNEDATGSEKLDYATQMQNLGDEIREEYGGDAVASLAIRKIKEIRAKESKYRKAIIVDSLKHPGEVNLLRTVYEASFLLVGVYSSNEIRRERLTQKFYGADPDQINLFMLRDAKDPDSKHGQQVRKAFHQADFFLDNSNVALKGHARAYDEDLRRFVKIMDGRSLIRPSIGEIAMFHAYTASLKSSCLSRQVGAALVNGDGEVISTGSNEVPAFGGGVYSDGHKGADNRCFSWTWWEGIEDKVDEKFQKPCCHNTRKKNELKKSISVWMEEKLPELASQALCPLPSNDEMDLEKAMREKLANGLPNFFRSLVDVEFENGPILDSLPGIGGLVEFSRSIHAEMDAILSASRIGAKTKDGTLYVTTYPCHNCARHLVAAGIKEVKFLEPYDKSLAVSLHWDSIQNEGTGETEMSVSSYTGIGPRVYEQYFLKRGEIKDESSGLFTGPKSEDFRLGVRLMELDKVEELAIQKLPDEVVI